MTCHPCARLFALLPLLGALAVFASGETPAGAEFRVNTTTTGDQAKAVSAGTSAGFVVVWCSPDGDDTGVFAQRFLANGSPAGTEFRVSATTTAKQWSPAVAMLARGSFVVVWEDGNSVQDIRGRRISSTGTPLGPEFRVNGYTSGTQRYPAVASEKDGAFVVVWSGKGGTDAYFGIWAQRFDAFGEPAGKYLRVNMYSTGDQKFPDIAWATDFIVVWEGEGPDDTRGIWAQRFDGQLANELGRPFRVNTSTSLNQVHPSVAVDSLSDGFVVAWLSYDDATSVGARRFNAFGSAEGPELNVAPPTDYAFAPGDVAVAQTPGKGFLVVWRSIHGVIAQRFTRAGEPESSSFRVNTTIGSQVFADAAALSTTQTLVTWSNNLQDGNLHGVYAQRFRLDDTACTAPYAGDGNGDGSVNVSDVLYLINNLFAGGPAPVCDGDANADGSVNVSDILYLINFLFAGGPQPL